MNTLSDLENLALAAVDGPHPAVSPAELHGATVGMGVVLDGPFEIQELVELFGVDALSHGDAVEEFVRATLVALMAEDMGFALLLPDDDEPMAERLAALAGWCQSFLAGLVAGLSRRGLAADDLRDEVAEIVRDLSAIGAMDIESGDTGEDDADFMELEEYVKVATILLMSLVNNAGDDPEE